MTPEKFEKLRSSTINLFKITDENLYDKTMQLMNYYVQYYDTYITELKAYKKLLMAKEMIYGKLFNDFKFNQNVMLKSKTEIDPLIHNNAEYHEKAIAVLDQEIQVKYLEGIIDSINKMSYNIKNLIDLKTMKMNGN